ncbi:Stf0 family sulfotransferase [Thalassomonas actiniarum]|uniref:Sulfotransferase domain-containing protein n=1 Tax=Thalassomonas actiniarum TaxID=485447 RepID=A0AAE9YXJ9_9GAMM|nr:Stf0 family sulfotransferase [Thalassomonas actiniarum]WDE02270.1 sulfotransferase domain-containing protein [Thalassomonas actiniarum]
MSIGHLNDLYSKHYDYARRSGKPLSSYMIATTPRSGSTLLGLKLWQTGVLGGPTEYLNLPYRHQLARRFGAQNSREYLEQLKTWRTSANGIFGCKLFWSHRVALQAAHPEMLQALAPTAYVFLTRDNKTAQAVSLSRSMQTHSWVASAEKKQQPKYVYRHILKCREYLRWQEEGWQQYLSGQKSKTLSVTYEELAKDPDSTTDNIRAFLGADNRDSAPVTLPEIHVQGNKESKIWQQRFNEDFQRLGYRDMDMQALSADFPGYVGNWSGTFPAAT